MKERWNGCGNGYVYINACEDSLFWMTVWDLMTWILYNNYIFIPDQSTKCNRLYMWSLKTPQEKQRRLVWWKKYSHVML